MATNVVSCVVGTADYAEASDGVVLPLHRLDATLAYNTNGTVNYMQVTSTFVYRATFTYDAALRFLGLSKWTKQ